MQDIQQSPIFKTIEAIRSNTATRAKNQITAQIHTAKADLPVTKLISVDVSEDYVANVGPYIYVRFQMGFGDYARRLYPERANIEMTIKRVALNGINGNRQNDAKADLERYKAVLLPDDNPQVNAGDLERMSTEELNIQRMVVVVMQLVPLPLEAARSVSVDRNYTQVTLEDLIRAVMFSTANEVKIHGKAPVDAVNVVKPDNTKPVPVVTISAGTLLPNLATYLHKRHGVYGSGLGTFFKRYRDKNTWFVYPLYNTRRYQESVPKAVFYAIPKERFYGEVNTYRVTGDLLEALVVGNRAYRDNGDTDYQSEGSGFRLADAGAFMRKPVEITKKGVKAKRSSLNHEVVNGNRPDGIGLAPRSQRGISSNPYVEYSAVVQRGLGRVDLTWQNGDIRQLYPGMPCQFVYLEKNIPKTVNGVVLFAHSVEAPASQVFSDTTFQSAVQVVLVTDMLPLITDESKTNIYGKF